MINKWNEFIDLSYTTCKKIDNDLKLKEKWMNFLNMDMLVNLRKELQKNETTSEIVNFVRMSNNYNVCNFKFNETTYSFEYIDRKWSTLIPCFLTVLSRLRNKRGGVFAIFRNYVIFSAFICRENFDLRNYKIKK